MAATDGETVDVRLAAPSDVAELVALNKGLFLEDSGTRDPFINPNGFDRHEYFGELIADGERNVAWSAEVRGTVVGYLVGRFRDANDFRMVSTAVLESMFVHSDHRDAGVGRALVDAFMLWASSAGAGAVEVTAYAENRGAIRFDRRFGFRTKGVTLDMAI